MSTHPVAAVDAPLPARQPGRPGRRRIDPALRRTHAITAMVTAAEAEAAWTAAQYHPAGLSGLVRDALASYLTDRPPGDSDGARVAYPDPIR